MVVVGEVAGVVLTFRVVERPSQELALVGQEPALVVRRSVASVDRG